MVFALQNGAKTYKRNRLPAGAAGPSVRRRVQWQHFFRSNHNIMYATKNISRSMRAGLDTEAGLDHGTSGITLSWKIILKYMRQWTTSPVNYSTSAL
ncbi:MAG: hypothetical protein LBC51_00735 [Treponema sp.]|nr:hypothetical protein [Treponema sp.]